MSISGLGHGIIFSKHMPLLFVMYLRKCLRGIFNKDIPSVRDGLCSISIYSTLAKDCVDSRGSDRTALMCRIYANPR